MIANLLRGALLTLLVAAAPALAQDFRVYTRIYDGPRVDEKTGQPAPPKSRTTTLFHAGKVYDFVDSGNQVTIFEPAQNRFVIVDQSRRSRMVFPLDEIQEFLYQAEQRAEQRLLSEWNRESRDDGALTAHQLNLMKFQLHPSFIESFDSGDSRLMLSSPYLSYTVRCVPAAEHAELLRRYLDYADRAARLNFILENRAQFPNPRLKLNDALRKHQLIPTEVSLQAGRPNRKDARSGPLTAEHRFDWTLDARDLHDIRFWETKLQDPSFTTKSPGPSAPGRAAARR